MLKKYLLELAVSVAVILAPIKMVLVTVGVLVAADLVFGIWAAKRRGEPLTSARLSHSVTKVLVYQAAVITGYLVEKYMLDNLLPVCNIIAGLIGSVELKSLLENGQDILGQPVFQTVVSLLKPKVEEISKDDLASSNPSDPTKKN